MLINVQPLYSTDVMYSTPVLKWETDVPTASELGGM